MHEPGSLGLSGTIHMGDPTEMPLHPKPPTSHKDSREAAGCRSMGADRGAPGEGWGAPAVASTGTRARPGGRLGQVADFGPGPQGQEGGQVQMGRPLPPADKEERAPRYKPPSRGELPARTAHKPQPGLQAPLVSPAEAVPARHADPEGPRGPESREAGRRRVGGHVPPVLPGCPSPAPTRKPE